MLDRLAPRAGATSSPKRIGRGPGSGTGKTAGRGMKGQGKRSPGRETPFWFEGGQMPLVRRVPKRGFTNIHRQEYSTVNLSSLDRFEEGAEVTPDLLAEVGLLHRHETLRVKLLGHGELDKRLTIKVHAASASARSKVEKAGGAVEILGAQSG